MSNAHRPIIYSGLDGTPGQGQRGLEEFCQRPMLRTHDVDRFQIRSESFSYIRVLYPRRKAFFFLIRDSKDWFQSVN